VNTAIFESGLFQESIYMHLKNTLNSEYNKIKESFSKIPVTVIRNVIYNLGF